MVDRFATELRRVWKAIDKDDKNLGVLNGLPQEYAVGRRMLEGRNDEPTRAHIEKVTLNQYDRLRAEKSKAGAKALAVAAAPGYHEPQSVLLESKWAKQRSKFDGECSTCGRRGHRGEECRGGKQKKKYYGCFICDSQKRNATNCPKH